MVFRHQVISNIRLNEKFNLIRLKSKNKNFFFRAGQFVAVRINERIYRMYSISSEPKILPYWNIFVDITPGGVGTTYLKLAKKGDLVETLNPRGQFVLNSKADNYVFGATGCGIAPFIPMINELIKDSKKNISLVWGLRYKKDIALATTLDTLRNKHANFSYEIVLSKSDENWSGKSGHATLPIIKKAKNYGHSATGVYLSGSREFVKETTEMLSVEKFPAKKIYFESCY